MPSAYVLARDHIEQARAILANEVWFDARIDHMFDTAIARLDTLDARLEDRPKGPAAAPRRALRVRLMPWLDP